MVGTAPRTCSHFRQRKHLSGRDRNLPGRVREILEVAVVGLPDERWGEVVVAAIVKQPGSMLDKAGVMRLLHGRLARFKQPRRVEFLQSLPKNALGKVQKPALKEVIARGA